MSNEHVIARRVELVRSTWPTVRKQPDGMIVFYQQLFTARPDLERTVFQATNLRRQSQMMASAIDFAVRNCHDPAALGAEFRDVGLRHCRYGITPEDYAPVVAALLWTLKYYLQDAFTSDVDAAWKWLLNAVVDNMAAPAFTADGRALIQASERTKQQSRRDAANFAWSERSVQLAVAVCVAAAAVLFVAVKMRTRRP